jgi:hypothetical protein
MPEQIRPMCFFLLMAAASALAADYPTEDHRAWQHGIDLIPVGNKLLLVWGSAGNPPHPNLGGDWPHDVYYAWLDPLALPDAATIQPKVLVSQPEAQEPPSTAINASGTLLMTSEDGNGEINQHAGMWDSSLHVLHQYPFTIRRGGHSGHAAAMGDKFLVVYGEGWVDGGGWRGKGTGESVYARIVEDNGKREPEIKLTPDQDPNPRDGWPLVAASDRNWLVVWQRYPQLRLQAALLDVAGKVVRRSQIMDRLPLRYAYDVEFAPQLSSYVVAGSSAGSGFISLVDLTGRIIKTQRGLPLMASESRILLHWEGAQMIGVYPVAPHGVAVVHLSADAIDLLRIIDNPYVWDYAGTSGVFLSPERVLFVTLSTAGLQFLSISLRD